jgi:CBS domain-containing protein
LDTLLIYEDIEPEREEKVRKYYQLLAQEIKKMLKECGYAESELGITADIAQWCQSVSTWKKYFTEWVQKPESIKNPNFGMFLDFRPVAGSFGLVDEVKSYVFESISKSSNFLKFLAKQALKNPAPMSFFGSFIVEQSGVQKNKFDIKSRALRPLADAARVWALEFKLNNYGSTFDRFKEVATFEPQLAEVCEAGAVAYEILLKLRATYGLEHDSSGRYILPDDLNKQERQTLRNIFKVIDKVQKALEDRYGL